MPGINKLLLIDLILFFYMMLQEQSLFSSVRRHIVIPRWSFLSSLKF